MDELKANLNLPLPDLPALAAQARAPLGAKAIQKVAKDFESVLLNRLMEQMQRTVGSGGLLESPVGEQVQGIFWFYLAQELSQKGGLGLWKEVYRQLANPAQPAVTEATG